MKNLLSITTLLFFCLFTFSSCTEKLETPIENEITEVAPTPVEKIRGLIGDITIFTPDGLEDGERAEYIASLSEGELVAKINTVKVFNFLQATGNLEKLVKENPNFENLTIDDVYKYAPREADNFYTHEKTGLRGCNITGEECFGNTLIVTERCCVWFVCWNQTALTVINAEECGGPPVDPCANANCNSYQYCSQGNCIYYPTCSPPCPYGQICTGYYCIYP